MVEEAKRSQTFPLRCRGSAGPNCRGAAASCGVSQKVLTILLTAAFFSAYFLEESSRRERVLEMAPEVGFEPTTDRLTADCSTAELLRNFHRSRWKGT